MSVVSLDRLIFSMRVRFVLIGKFWGIQSLLTRNICLYKAVISEASSETTQLSLHHMVQYCLDAALENISHMFLPSKYKCMVDMSTST